jgi:hypothetical protein
MFKDSVRTALQVLFVWVINTSSLMLHKEIIAACSENHTKSIDLNTLCGQKVGDLVHVVTTRL